MSNLNVPVRISTHSPRTGRDARNIEITYNAQAFQPTLPARGETAREARSGGGFAISTHSPRTGRDFAAKGRYQGGRHFNPLSPHGERPHIPGFADRCLNFNPLSPHGERPRSVGGMSIRVNFNPLSPHGERPGFGGGDRGGTDFNPLSPHGERLHASLDAGVQACISTHSPRTGRDDTLSLFVRRIKTFQPTLPARGETTPIRLPSRVGV